MNVRRRTFLALSAGVPLAGCSEVPFLGESMHQLEDSVEFGEVSVTVSEAMTYDTVAVDGDRYTAPSNAKFALFLVEAVNNDITSREIPTVNPSAYDFMHVDEGAIAISDPNDIRVYGSGEGGYLPDKQLPWSFYDQIIIRGNRLPTYPAQSTGTNLDANSSVEGWVFGLIPSDSTPQLKVDFQGKEATWTAEGATLTPPNPVVR